MITSIYKKIAARIGKLAFFNIFDPSTIDANGHVMFSFTRYGTGMTAYTLALIDNKSIFHKKIDISLLLLLRDVVYNAFLAPVHRIPFPILSVEKKQKVV